MKNILAFFGSIFIVLSLCFSVYAFFVWHDLKVIDAYYQGIEVGRGNYHQVNR